MRNWSRVTSCSRFDRTGIGSESVRLRLHSRSSRIRLWPKAHEKGGRWVADSPTWRSSGAKPHAEGTVPLTTWSRLAANTASLSVTSSTSFGDTKAVKMSFGKLGIPRAASECANPTLHDCLRLADDQGSSTSVASAPPKDLDAARGHQFPVDYWTPQLLDLTESSLALI